MENRWDADVSSEDNSSQSTSPSLDSGQQMLFGIGLAALTERLAKLTTVISAMLEQNSQIISILIQREQEDQAEDELPPPMNSRPS